MQMQPDQPMRVAAYGFSRFPLSIQPREVPTPQELVYLLEDLEISPVTVDQIRSWID